jgi:hypothetical protein
MDSTDIVIIEGNHEETKVIRDEILSDFRFEEVYEYESTSEFSKEDIDCGRIGLIVADLLEHYESSMSKDDVTRQINNTFNQIMTPKVNEPYGILFLTKVPPNYIKRSMTESSELFPHSSDGIEESYKDKRTVMYSSENVILASKPYYVDEDTMKTYYLDEDDEIHKYNTSEAQDIVKKVNNKFGVSTRRSPEV